MAQAAVKIFEREGEALESEVLDRARLARMTFNDRSLEREVLQLFNRQAELLSNASAEANRPRLLPLRTP